MRCMLDTNICIYIIKRTPPQVLDRLRTMPPGGVAVSAITIAELRHGVDKSRRPKHNEEALIRFLGPLEVVSFDENAAIHYGKIRAHLEQSGTPIGAMDMLIAAHARSLSLTLVTNNMREFERVPELRLENWAEP